MRPILEGRFKMIICSFFCFCAAKIGAFSDSTIKSPPNSAFYPRKPELLANTIVKITHAKVKNYPNSPRFFPFPVIFALFWPKIPLFLLIRGLVATWEVATTERLPPQGGQGRSSMQKRYPHGQRSSHTHIYIITNLTNYSFFTLQR